jgi:hypothetical protein
LPAYFYNNGNFQFNQPIDGYLIIDKDGKKITKGTYGIALMNVPFFMLAHRIAVNQDSPRDGFSEPYSTCMHWAGIFYGLLGLFLLRQFLIKHYSEIVTATVLALIFFGTTVFAYTYAFSEMSHVYLFMLFSGILALTNNFYEKPTTWRFAILGLLFGLISLIRLVDSIILMVFFFWSVSNLEEAKKRVLFFLTNPRTLLIILVFFIIWIPQMLFWKQHMGSYLHYAYPGEKFFWGDPQLVNILFSYRKGWLLYCPLMIFAFVGMFFMKSQHGRNRYTLLIVICTVVYIYSCWWDWFFGGCFGGRPFVAYHAMLALPLAAFVKWIFSDSFRKYITGLKFLLVGTLFYLLCLNIGQTHQYVNGLIHYNAMSKKAYWHVYGKYVIFGMDSNTYWESLDEPNYPDLLEGKRDQ